MMIDVLHGEAPLEPTNAAARVVVVIDVFRAATTVATALANGAIAVHPFANVEETLLRSKDYSKNEVVLAGERNMLPIEGFDIGNSPREVSAQVVAGKTILFTTTNGTRALNAAAGARQCFFVGFVNVQATINAVRAVIAQASSSGDDEHLGEVLIVCSGTDGKPSLEDTVCAGRIVRLLKNGSQVAGCSDSALIAEYVERQFIGDVGALEHIAQHAARLKAAGFAPDVELCLSLDRYSRAVSYVERELVHYSSC